MSKFVVEIETGNAAFGENQADMAKAVEDILIDLAYDFFMVQKLLYETKPLHDSNGNTVGFAKLVP